MHYPPSKGCFENMTLLNVLPSTCSDHDRLFTSASVCSSLNHCGSVWTWNGAVHFKGFWAYNGDGSLFCWCVTGSAEALRDGRL